PHSCRDGERESSPTACRARPCGTWLLTHLHNCIATLTVAVGMPVTRHPPHSSRRAALPHRALASGHDAQTLRGIGMQDVGGRQPLGGKGVYPLPGDTMTLTAPSKRLTPIAEYTFAKHPQHAHVARHSIIPIMPRKHTLEPCPKLPDGPVQPLPQGLFDLLQLPAEPLGDRLAPHRKLALPRLATDMREAEKVKGFRFPLATSLAPFTGPTPELNEARLVRVQCEVKPVEACPQVAQKLLGVVFVLEADDEIVTVPHDDDVSPCVP